jgi:hypothetical protein
MAWGSYTVNTLDGPVDVAIAGDGVQGSRPKPYGSALGKGGLTSSGSSQTLVASNSARDIVEVANGGTAGIWVAFGSSAVAGQGSYVPPGATGYWYMTAQVNVIQASGGGAGAVGYTEWG